MINLKEKQSPFSTKTYYGNVVLNFTNIPESEFSSYANAFHEAGKTLIKDIKKRNGYSDLEACPIVFLYRHALELHFKSIIIIGENILCFNNKSLPINKEDIFKDHSLKKMLPAIKEIIKEVGWSWDLGIEGLKKYEHFEKFINTIEYIDPKSFAFRYPTNKKGKSHLPKHFVFNVIEFGTKMDKILDLLSGASLGLSEMFNAAAEEYHGGNI